jgi:serine/threonine-protein kinase RsbW
MRAKLDFASGFDEVTCFMRRLSELLAVSEFAMTDQFAIQLAVEEALLNAVKHGNQMDPQKRVHLRFVVGSKGFRIQIRDEGRGFDPDGAPDATDPMHLERPTGRGLRLIRHYMHEVRFNAKGNAVTLVRRRSPA